MPKENCACAIKRIAQKVLSERTKALKYLSKLKKLPNLTRLIHFLFDYHIFVIQQQIFQSYLIGRDCAGAEVYYQCLTGRALFARFRKSKLKLRSRVTICFLEHPVNSTGNYQHNALDSELLDWSNFFHRLITSLELHSKSKWFS